MLVSIPCFCIRESSLRLRRERSNRYNAWRWHRIIPPLTEGTKQWCLLIPFRRNHPSAYGGNCVSSSLDARGLESSLRLRRELSTLPFTVVCKRIIPPLTEGTSIAGVRLVVGWNHPSAYGGNTKQNQHFMIVGSSCIREYYLILRQDAKAASIRPFCSNSDTPRFQQSI